MVIQKFLRNLFRKASTNEGQPILSERSKGTLMLDRKKCIHCGMCVRECPVGALRFGDDKIPVCDSGVCIQCGRCVEVCPVKAYSWAQKIQPATRTRKGLVRFG